MSKMPLSWHKQNLENQIIHFSHEEEQVARALRDLERSRKQVQFAREQIEEAERRGLEGFDAERLLKGKRP